ncbi:D-alanyl-D-alanine carboxypeptidase family protein [Lederbergia lenta]|nr:D-alanyl-D-alanine carboxypeptidase family protein [Lederbergia lenta]MCM3111564.1 D-alanyl-D-alanine carboxypeptidase [Lederbergia lenta]MEC2325048.1 D-alanyl-D-alanine carboxypeptidase [Lederbergia lenta]
MKSFVRNIICLVMIFTLFSQTVLAEEKHAELSDDSKSAILIEKDTGAILYDKNSHEKLPPASMTKIMTLLLIMEAIDSGKLTMEDKVRTSEYAASMGGSQIFLEPGEEMKVKEMLLAISLASANDASVAMAEKIAGSEEAFVDMMNKRVKSLGLKNTKFNNTTGLPVEDHYSTAYDMAMMAKELLKYEDITDFTKQYESYLRENTDKKFWLVNTNKLVKFYPGVDGLKTGFTGEAKYCLTATAKKDDMRVVAVVFGATTSKSRNAQVTKMLDYAFAQYATHSIHKKGKVIEKVKVSKGNHKEINAITGDQVSVLTKKGDKTDGLKTEIKINKQLNAPIKKGEQIGTIIIKKEDKELSKTPLVAEKDVKKATWWELYKRAFGLFTQSR